MLPEGFKPGDRVVELAALTSSTALATGAVSGAWVTWMIRREWPASIGAFFAGAALGYLTARIVGRALYRTADGNTTIVSVGSASLAATIPAGLAGGIPTALLVAGLAVTVFGANDQGPLLLGTALGCGITLGVIFACISSLT